jgi:hypothetical protein
MVTFRWTKKQERSVTRTESAITTGPVNKVVGQSSSGPGQPAQPIWRTQLGTFVTTWQTQTSETVKEPHTLVLVFETKDGKPLSPTTELRSDPVLQARRVGREAGRDVLEFVLKNWSMRLEARVIERLKDALCEQHGCEFPMRVYCALGALTSEIKRWLRGGRIELAHFPYDPDSHSRRIPRIAEPSSAQIRDLNLPIKDGGFNGSTQH